MYRTAYGTPKFHNDEQKELLIAANRDMKEFLEYIKDGYLQADFTIKEGHVVLVNTTRGRAEYIARRYFNLDNTAVTKVTDSSNNDTYKCTDCFFHDKREGQHWQVGDYCTSLKCYMTTMTTCKHFKLSKAGEI